MRRRKRLRDRVAAWMVLPEDDRPSVLDLALSLQVSPQAIYYHKAKLEAEREEDAASERQAEMRKR